MHAQIWLTERTNTFANCNLCMASIVTDAKYSPLRQCNTCPQFRYDIIGIADRNSFECHNCRSFLQLRCDLINLYSQPPLCYHICCFTAVLIAQRRRDTTSLLRCDSVGINHRNYNIALIFQLFKVQIRFQSNIGNHENLTATTVD